MVISKKQLEKLDVMTQSGDYLGKVVDFELDVDSGIVIRFVVKTAQPIVGLFEQGLLIHRDAIVSMNDRTMIVLDEHRGVGEENGGGGRRAPIKDASPAITKTAS